MDESIEEIKEENIKRTDNEEIQADIAHDTCSPTSSSMRDSPCSLGPPDKPQEVRKNNVSELVAKSKKAASSLWTLLHAKVCFVALPPFSRHWQMRVGLDNLYVHHND
jgi:hypothetical protein